MFGFERVDRCDCDGKKLASQDECSSCRALRLSNQAYKEGIKDGKKSVLNDAQYRVGLAAGRKDGYKEGHKDGYQKGHNDGRLLGRTEGIQYALNKKPDLQEMTPDIITKLIKLCHPDKHNNSTLSNEITKWLLAKRK